MAVKIRLKRMGAKKKPSYRIVVCDGRVQRDSKAIEELGFYDPTTDPATYKVQEDKALLWLERGATPTPTVKNLLNRAGVMAKHQAKKNEK